MSIMFFTLYDDKEIKDAKICYQKNEYLLVHPDSI